MRVEVNRNRSARTPLEELEWEKHPYYWAPTPEWIQGVHRRLTGDLRGKLQRYHALRKRKIVLEEYEPLQHGFVFDIWRDAQRLLDNGRDLLILGGNRSSKSKFASWYLVKMLVASPKRQAWAFQQNEKQSIDCQQPYIWQYLGMRYQRMGKQGSTTYIKYTEHNGFSEGLFILPSGSKCRFRNYEQKPGSLEGAELDLCWCDELVPPDFLETLRVRTVDRAGKMLVTFTPIEGYSQTVRQYLEGAKIVQTRPAELLDQKQVHVRGCPPGHMPYILDCAVPRRHVILFPTKENPYAGYEALGDELRHRPKGEIMCRAYGWPTKQIAGAFPLFGDINILPGSKIPENGVNYCIADPGGRKNWFIIWIRATLEGMFYIYREWPRWNVEGAWALPSGKDDGKAGPAQTADMQRGGPEVRRMIRELENGEEILERIIDPRPVAALHNDATTLLDKLAEDDEDNPGMEFLPAPGLKIEQGLQVVNSWLDYDPVTPLSSDNQPRLYVSEDCENTIYCMRTWTGADGERGASKDPCDCVRYAATAGIRYLDTLTLTGNAGRGF
jgi:phage terminase large subunit-like protein